MVPQDTVLFLLAHNDDEFFVLPRIRQELSARSRVVCVYTTDGAAYGISPDIRLAETLSVLSTMGLNQEDIIPLGMRLGVKDGESFRHIMSLWSSLCELTQHLTFARVYAPSWEGGHVDHDTSHLLGAALCRKKGGVLYEFSLYNGYKIPPPFFRCMTLVPAPGGIVVDKVSFSEALQWLLTIRKYRSQRKTFLGLFGFCLKAVLLKRELAIRIVRDRNYLSRPHDGPMLYETRFRVPHAVFIGETAPFIEKLVVGRESSDPSIDIKKVSSNTEPRAIGLR